MAPAPDSRPELAIFDLDGTLVDTNYQHTQAWFRAFRAHGLVLPMWRIHRANGMGGDKLVAHLGGDELEQEVGDVIRAAQDHEYAKLIEEVEPLAGARELLTYFKGEGLAVYLASSAKSSEVERYVDLLEARDLVDGWTTGDEVEETKPAPDLVAVVLEKSGSRNALMVGDTTWDVRAAAKVGVPTVCVLTGGFGADELRHAGAIGVFESLPDLQAHLAGSDRWLVAAPG